MGERVRERFVVRGDRSTAASWRRAQWLALVPALLLGTAPITATSQEPDAASQEARPGPPDPERVPPEALNPEDPERPPPNQEIVEEPRHDPPEWKDPAGVL